MLITSALITLVCFLQVPGHTVADTKLDLTANPIGFLARAAHMWNAQMPLGQVQNQAYGYFFPHGAVFAIADLLMIPGWITQRLWWSALLIAGFWGVVRLAEALGIGSRPSRMIAAVAYITAPRVLTTLTAISSETLPVMLAPWVLLPIVTYLSGRGHDGPRRSAARSALAVAAMGAVNAVATLAATLPTILWLLLRRPEVRVRRVAGWWVVLTAAATAWWFGPLLLLGSISPPFLDFIESSSTTTRWASLVEVLRGTSSWTAFVSPERIAGTVLITQPEMIVLSGTVAAFGLAGLTMRSMPARGSLLVLLLFGLTVTGAGYLGTGPLGGLGSPIAEPVRVFLDGVGAPLRNVHKFEPLIRLPLVLGIAHAIGRVSLPGAVPRARWRAAVAHPERQPAIAAAGLLLVAITLAGSLAWTGKLAPTGAYRSMPEAWQEASDWLADNAGDTRALVAPGAPVASQVWGLTRDEPLQPLARSPWVVRDAVPLVTPGAIRALDSVQRLFADGRPSAGLADTLLGQGIGFVIARNDLDAEMSRSTRPLLVHATLAGSPGLTRVAAFGDRVGPGEVDGIVSDADLRPTYRMIEIYRVDSPPPAGSTVAPLPAAVGPTDPYVVDADALPRVQGGPESLQRLNEHRGRGGLDPVPNGPVLLAADARRAGLPVDDVLVTDTPTARETDYGQVDNHSSALRAPDDPRRVLNEVSDYPVADTPLVEGRWEGGRITVSSAAADATQLGGSAPGSSAAATIDGDPATSWLSNGLEAAVGQWLRIDLDEPIAGGLLQLRSSGAATGTPVKWVEVATNAGTTAVRIAKPGDLETVALPGSRIEWISITARQTEDGSAGGQFGISELSVDDYSDPQNPFAVPIRFRTALPETEPGARVIGWDLSQELPGRAGCFDAPDRVRCAGGMALAPEQLGRFDRELSVPMGTAVTPQLWVRTRQGPELETLLTEPDRPIGRGTSDVGDLRGTAFALTDSDPRTSWTATEESIRSRTGRPTVTIELPGPTLVDGLELRNSLGSLPAHTTRIAVDLGAGPQVRDLTDKHSDDDSDKKSDDDKDPKNTDSGDEDSDDKESDKKDSGSAQTVATVRLRPTVTNRIVVSLVDWEEVIDRAGLGFTRVQPPGLAEITVLTPDGPLARERPDPNRVITLGCGFGPTIEIAGQQVRTSVTASVRQLKGSEPVAATICQDDMPIDPASAPPIPLPEGNQTVEVAPSPMFFTDQLRLIAAPRPAVAPAPPRPEPVITVDWASTQRAVAVDAADRDRILVVPESTNPGWRASVAGTELTAVVVNGWQQGWLIPSGVDGRIDLTFGPDRWYRLALFGGLPLLVIPLLAAGVLDRVRGRHRRPEGHEPPARTYGGRLPAAVGLVAAAGILTGPVGVTVALIALVVAGPLRARLGSERVATGLVVVSGTSYLLAAIALAAGPWRSSDGYAGTSAGIQLLAVIAVVAAGVSAIAVPPEGFFGGIFGGFFGRFGRARPKRRRAGSSINA